MYLANELEKKLQDIKNAIPRIEAGGGGSSDFSTAEVTITNSTGETQQIATSFPVLMEGGTPVPSDPPLVMIMPYIGIDGNEEEKTFDIPLYKGVLCVVGDANITSGMLSGNIENKGGLWYITGDCLIDFSR